MKPRHLALALLVLTAGHAATASDTVRVSGYFCDTRHDQVAFLALRAAGENDIMAANAVNKAAGKPSCADYISVEVIPGSEKVVMSGGLVYKMQSFTFLPEKVERWYGSVFGSLSQIAEKEL